MFVEDGSSADPVGLERAVDDARTQGLSLSVVAVAAEPSEGFSPYAGKIATNINAGTVVVVGPTGLGWASQEPDFYQEEFERAWSLIPPGSTENGAVASLVRSVLGGPDSVGVMEFATATWLLLRFDGTPTEFTFGDTDDLPSSAIGTATGFRRRASGVTPPISTSCATASPRGKGTGASTWTNHGFWPASGDFNGDTCGTQGVTTGLCGQHGLLSLTRGAKKAKAVSNPMCTTSLETRGDIPFVGDFDGDGIDTLGLFRPSTGMFYLKNTQHGGSGRYRVRLRG